MKDAGFALSIAYAALFTGLSYNNKPVKVYDGMAADDAVAPYLIIDSWVPQPGNTKTTFGQNGQINIQVVTRFVGNVFSKKPANDIANTVTGLIKPTLTAEVLNVPGFRTWNTRIGETTEITSPTNTDKMFRKIITVQHSLTQL